ncbi:hypothetical protein [uncultured Roseibium sp.]|uniref:hypothetical protein n=1 Tax=uncultured Roseibium sp. TaxID=1936171 RepID=UPI0026098C73|nr:hypothetical protein [uncultured Roseibium sp.]
MTNFARIRAALQSLVNVIAERLHSLAKRCSRSRLIVSEELELKRLEIRELELKCELERIEMETLRQFSPDEFDQAPNQQSFVYEAEHPPPDFETFYVLVEGKNADPFEPEDQLFTVSTCNRAGQVGELWYRTSEERALGLASWIVSNHERCEGLVNRVDVVEH